MTQPELSQPDRAPSTSPNRPYPYGNVPETVRPYGIAPGANPPGGHPAAPPAGYGYRPAPVMRPVVDVGGAWRWAWARLKDQPLLLAPMLLWVVVGLAVGLTGTYLISEMPDVDNRWGIAFLPVMFFLFGIGLLAQTRASLVVASGRRLRARHLVTLPNAVRSILLVCLCGVLQIVGGITGILGAVAAYFFLFATRGALARRLGVFKAIGRHGLGERDNARPGGLGAVHPVPGHDHRLDRAVAGGRPHDHLRLRAARRSARRLAGPSDGPLGSSPRP